MTEDKRLPNTPETHEEALEWHSIISSVVARKNEKSNREARTDSLTGLPNRRALNEGLSKEVVRAKRHGHFLSLIMLDVDDMKDINDKYGHPTGDRALKHVSRGLERILRGSDMPCRYGGDEFTVILPETDEAGAKATAERLEQYLQERPFEPIDGKKLAIIVSQGVVALESWMTPETFLKAADDLMYQAKKDEEKTIVTASGLE